MFSQLTDGFGLSSGGLVAEYHKSHVVESAFSFHKTWYGLTPNKVRHLADVSVYVLLSVLFQVLSRKAAENVGRPE